MAIAMKVGMVEIAHKSAHRSSLLMESVFNIHHGLLKSSLKS
jgi:hypothetical protein